MDNHTFKQMIYSRIDYANKLKIAVSELCSEF